MCSPDDLEGAMKQVDKKLEEEFMQTMKAQQDAYIDAQRPLISKNVESDEQELFRIKKYLSSDDHHNDGVIPGEDELKLKKLVDKGISGAKEFWESFQKDKQEAAEENIYFSVEDTQEESQKTKK